MVKTSGALLQRLVQRNNLSSFISLLLLSVEDFCYLLFMPVRLIAYWNLYNFH